MELKIGGKNYELSYGLSFINSLDNIYTQDMSGVQLGMGVEMLNTYLELGRPTALYNAIKAGTSHLNSQPANSDIERYLEDVAVEDDDKYENLFDDIKKGMEQAPFLKRALKNMSK